MSRATMSGRIDPRVMERIAASAALTVAKAYGIGTDDVGAACSVANGHPGFVSEAVRTHCSEEDR